MKYCFTLLLSFFILAASAQQASDAVETGASYTNQIWYSFANGEVASAPKDNWDLAFEASGFTSSIRFNEQKGMALYAAPYSMGQWADVDTTGMAANWQMLHNDPKSWERGAFNLYSTADVDLGWGIYNPITHVVSGDSLYVIQLANGDFKKLRIDNLASGTYNFTIANVDGSQETAAQLVRSNFSGKNFGYYNLETNEALDREPANDSWDITFTKYIDLVGPDADTPYGVTGVLQNKLTPAAQADDVPVGEAQPFDFSYSADINIIGHDWKSYDFSNNTYLITEDQSFFVETANGTVYQVIFTAFEGSETGVYEFTTEEVGSTGLTEVEKYSLTTFPNPSNGQNVRITWDTPSFNQLQVYDMSGKMVYNLNLSQQALSTIIESNKFPAGVYILRLSGNGTDVNQKLVITN